MSDPTAPTGPADPFEALAAAPEAVEPRPEFARRLRRTVSEALGRPAEVPVVDLPERSPVMSSTNPLATSSPAAVRTVALAPYLAVHDGEAALAYYVDVLGAEVTLRFDGADGRIGHAELVVGPVRFFLADEHPEIDFRSPRSLGGTPVSLHLEVRDVDALFDRAVRAGAEPQQPPEDMPYGHRQGTLVDPFGHRWMLSQHLESVGVEELTERMSDGGYVIGGTWVDEPRGGAPSTGADRAEAVARNGRVWAAINATDAPALIRMAIDVLGFTEQIVVPGDGAGVVAHSQLAWPEGGVVQIASAHRAGNPFSEQATGSANIYVVTDEPMPVYERCVAAGLEIVRAPESSDYDPGGTSFSFRDPEGNLWSFGTYAGE